MSITFGCKTLVIDFRHLTVMSPPDGADQAGPSRRGLGFIIIPPTPPGYASYSEWKDWHVNPTGHGPRKGPPAFVPARLTYDEHGHVVSTTIVKDPDPPRRPCAQWYTDLCPRSSVIDLTSLPDSPPSQRRALPLPLPLPSRPPAVPLARLIQLDRAATPLSQYTIGPDNPGHRLLQGIGWTGGPLGLGASTAPISTALKLDRRGLGQSYTRRVTHSHKDIIKARRYK